MIKRLFIVAAMASFLGTGIGAALADTVAPPGASQTSLKDVLFKKFGRKPIVAASVQTFQIVTIQKWVEQMKLAADFEGIDLRLADAQGDSAKQADQIDAFIAQKPDIILVDPVDLTAVVPAIKRINAAGIPVMNYDGGVAKGGNILTFIGHDWLAAGIMSGLQIVAATGGEGNVVLVQGEPGSGAMTLRTQGINMVLAAYPKLKIVAQEPANWNRDKALTVTESILQAQPHIDAFYFQNDEMYFGGVKAINAAGRRGEMKILSVDGDPAAYDAIRKGQLDYEVTGQFLLQGWLTIQTAAQYLAGQKVGAFVPVKLYMVDLTNVETTPTAW